MFCLFWTGLWIVYLLIEVGFYPLIFQLFVQAMKMQFSAWVLATHATETGQCPLAACCNSASDSFVSLVLISLYFLPGFGCCLVLSKFVFHILSRVYNFSDCERVSLKKLLHITVLFHLKIDFYVLYLVIQFQISHMCFNYFTICSKLFIGLE